MDALGEVTTRLKAASRVPLDQRGQAWHALVDSLLTERDRLISSDGASSAATEQHKRSTRLLSPKETR